MTLLLTSQSYFSTAQWIKQSPIPTGQDISNICFINHDTGWVFGSAGTIFRTNDGGETWIDQSVTSLSEIFVGIFLDSMNGWIVLSDDYQNNDGQIYRTDDGGYTWYLQFLNHTCAIRDLSFINPDTGWALAYYRKFDPVPEYRNFFLKTVDGGNNWLVMDTLEQSHFRSLDFINDTAGYIAGPGTPNLMKTVDGGMSWQASPHPSSAGLTDVFFTDIANGFSCGNNFYYTHNSGATWNLTYCYFANAVDMYNDSSGWTFSIDKVYKVTHGGQDAEYQLTVNKSILLDISAVDSACAYVTGRNVTILSTGDGGDSWHEISNGTQKDLYSIFFLNENEGWAGGSDHTLLSTHDGGRHWIYNDVNASVYGITGIQFINPDTGWFVNGDVYRSIDGGSSWSQTSGWSYPVCDLYFIDYQLGWCVGSEGRLYKSDNGGIDWMEKSSGTVKNLNAVYFTDENTGWTAGNGIVLKTNDGGETWEEKYVSNEEFLKIQFFNDSIGYVLAADLYLKTYTGGESWQVFEPEGMPGAHSLKDLCFMDEDEGYLSGSDYLLKTTDGGATWSSDQGYPPVKTNAIFFIDKDKGWIAGSEGMIYQTETGGSNSVENPAIGEKSSPYIIFPNPSGDVITVKYFVESAENVEIGIYTLQGTRIRYLKETGLDPGNYSFDWEPGNLPSGIYLCKIRIGDFAKTEKIVYVK